MDMRPFIENSTPDGVSVMAVALLQELETELIQAGQNAFAQEAVGIVVEHKPYYHFATLSIFSAFCTVTPLLLPLSFSIREIALLCVLFLLLIGLVWADTFHYRVWLVFEGGAIRWKMKRFGGRRIGRFAPGSVTEVRDRAEYNFFPPTHRIFLVQGIKKTEVLQLRPIFRRRDREWLLALLREASGLSSP